MNVDLTAIAHSNYYNAPGREPLLIALGLHLLLLLMCAADVRLKTGRSCLEAARQHHCEPMPGGLMSVSRYWWSPVCGSDPARRESMVQQCARQMFERMRMAEGKMVRSIPIYCCHCDVAIRLEGRNRCSCEPIHRFQTLQHNSE